MNRAKYFVGNAVRHGVVWTIIAYGGMLAYGFLWDWHDARELYVQDFLNGKMHNWVIAMALLTAAIDTFPLDFSTQGPMRPAPPLLLPPELSPRGIDAVHGRAHAADEDFEVEAALLGKSNHAPGVDLGFMFEE